MLCLKLFFSVSACFHCDLHKRFPDDFEWQQAKQVILVILLIRNTFKVLLGDHEMFPGQTRYIISPAGSGSTFR